MKNLLLLGLLLFSFVVKAQTDGMSYQAVILNPDLQLPGVNDVKNIYNNQDLTVRFTIYDSYGAVEYQETQQTRTDDYGMINLIIGQGNPLAGVYTEIFWDGTPKSLKVEINLGSDYKDLSEQQLLFTPFAYHRDIIATGFLTVDGAVTFNNTLDVGGATHLGSTLTVEDDATFNGDLTVAQGGKTDLTGDLVVDGTTNLNSSLTVNNNSPVEFSGDLVVDGTTNLNNTLSVNKGTATLLTGTLTVDGVTDLNNDLNVNNLRPTYLSGTLDVDGATNLDNTLVVAGATNLNSSLNVNNGSPVDFSGDLTVDGVTNLNSTLYVNNGAWTSLSGNLTTTGATQLNSTLTVEEQTLLNESLTVANQSPTALTGDLRVDGLTNLGNDFTVENQSLSTLTGDLIVDGTTNLNSGLYVNNQSPTELSGDLSVGGAFDLNGDLLVRGTTTLQKTLDVTGATFLRNTLNLTGAAYLNNTLNVTGASYLNNTLRVAGASTLNNTLTVAGLTTLNNKLNANGQVTIVASLNGNDDDYNVHPLRVEGSNQGIAIKLTAGTPTNDNNFLTFYNAAGNAVGRVEGETYAERIAEDEYQFEQGILIAEEVVAVANVALAAIPIVVAGFGASAGPDIGGIAIAAADLVLATANLIAFEEFNKLNIGVTYSSGSADYAEWLERIDANEKMTPADIVGVYGGKITKYTEQANKFMVVSTKPAILGNMPMAGEENKHEKVAFMGQIPVKVNGVVRIGDYILPSGNNDGTGIAVSPENIKPEQYAQIVGVAWQENLIDLGRYNLINMAIGLNHNDVAHLVVKQDKKITELENKYASLEARLSALESGRPYVAPTPKKEEEKKEEEKKEESVKTTQEGRAELIAKNMPKELSDEIMTEAIAYLKTSFEQKGIDITKHKGLNMLFNDKAYQQKVIQKAQETYKANYERNLKLAQMVNN